MLSNEKFFEKLNPVMNMFKLRATWGLVGNDAIPKRISILPNTIPS